MSSSKNDAFPNVFRNPQAKTKSEFLEHKLDLLTTAIMDLF